MATLFSPTKRVIQEGDLAIIWIVSHLKIDSNKLESQYSSPHHS